VAMAGTAAGAALLAQSAYLFAGCAAVAARHAHIVKAATNTSIVAA